MTPSGSGLQRVVERYVTNPGMLLALRAGTAPAAFALIETIGRRTGRRRLTPVGNGLDGNVFWLVSEHGEGSGYVKNLLAHPRVRIKVRRQWRSGVATPVPDDDAWARRQRIDRRNGPSGWIDGLIFRASASDPMTIRIDLHG